MKPCISFKGTIQFNKLIPSLAFILVFLQNRNCNIKTLWNAIEELAQPLVWPIHTTCFAELSLCLKASHLAAGQISGFSCSLGQYSLTMLVRYISSPPQSSIFPFFGVCQAQSFPSAHWGKKIEALQHKASFKMHVCMQAHTTQEGSTRKDAAHYEGLCIGCSQHLLWAQTVSA